MNIWSRRKKKKKSKARSVENFDALDTYEYFEHFATKIGKKRSPLKKVRRSE